MASGQIVARLSKADYTLADIDAKAEELGMSRTEFILEAVEILLRIDTDFYKKIQRYGKFINAPAWRVMQNVITVRLAKEAASDEVYGSRPRMLDEFYTSIGSDGDIMAPDFCELFEHLKEKYVHEFKRTRDEETLRNILRNHSPEMSLSDEERPVYEKFLKRFTEDFSGSEEKRNGSRGTHK